MRGHQHVLMKSLVPFVAAASGLDDLVDDGPARCLERSERQAHGASGFDGAMERYRILQREPGARSDAEVNRAQRITDEHDVTMRPARIRRHGEAGPHGLVRQ